MISEELFAIYVKALDRLPNEQYVASGKRSKAME